MNVQIALRNGRRSGSTPLEWALEKAGHELHRPERGWKHGLVAASDWPTIVLSKHPLAWMRSRVRWALPTPRFRWYNPCIQKVFEWGKKVVCSRWEPGQRLVYSPLLDSWFRGYAYWFSELDNYLHVRHIDLLKYPEKETERIANFLDIDCFSMPDEKINPNGGRGCKGSVGSFDKEFYIERRWLDWYTDEELDFVYDYIYRESENRLMPELLNGMGYHVDVD